ncbi:Hypothetical predicted protein [Paramuricea clavata]|uniref:E3 ubiquitin-protein ligase E3D n=1 Tax=Paramuricea clavata TaxID=317549 RepID=A0A7D9DR90_PARCT|nr:Hypothetical predicted protein [Paramuricea clavata]
MERAEDTQLLYFGEIHEKIKVFNLVIDPSSCVDDKHVASVKLKVDQNGLSVFKAESIIEVPFKAFTIKPLSAQTVKIVEFSRMLELPSENWQEYLDNWCCHGNEAITKLKDGLDPREHDCFFGDWYILIHPQAVNTQHVHVAKENESSQLLCGRCQATLGKLNFSGDGALRNQPCQDINDCVSVQLYKHSISLYRVLDSASKDIFKNYGEEFYLARNFVTLTKTRMCHKFIVNTTSLTTKRKDSSIVLIWILNSDTKFVSSFYNAKYGDESKDSTNLFSAVKVLYKSYLDHEFKSLKDEWYGNAQTDIVSFPEEICLKLLLLLNENNKIQPPSLRTANGFNVSFLKL